MNYRMLLQYDGTRYDGWQRQGNTEKTIQGKLEQVLSRMTGEAVEVIGSGRTDAGVHARGQTANFHLKEARPSKELLSGLNAWLPADIRVLLLAEAGERFHSRFTAVSKWYRYQIWLGDKADVFRRSYFYSLPAPLDTGRMEQAARYLEGTRDFKSFCANKRMKKSTVRRIDSIGLLQNGEELYIDYRGNGFLQQMVRILTGTLIEVGQGKRRPEEMEAVLGAGDRQAAGFTAPPQGLFLMEVNYEGEL